MSSTASSANTLIQLMHDVATPATVSSLEESTRQALVAAAGKLITQLENPMEQVARIGWGEPSRTAALQSAFELGLLNKLDMAQAKSSAELAEGTGAEVALVARIVKHLAAYHLIRETAEDRYLATPFTMATSHPSISGALTYSFQGMIPCFAGLPSYLAENQYQQPSDPVKGPIQHGLRTDKSFFQVLGDNPRLGQAFNDFMAGYAQARPSWTDFYPYEERIVGQSSGSDALNKQQQQQQRPLLVDVGGGTGHDLGAFYDKVSENVRAGSTFVLQDLPGVIAQAQKSGTLPAQVRTVAHDFFQPQPESCSGAACFFLRQILHDWPDDKCLAILGNLGKAMGPNSKLVINEVVLDNVGAPWQQTSLDWTMMAMLVSHERTETQWRRLLDAAGFSINGIWKSDKGNESVIEAVVAAAAS